jgi:biotin--protein ligase
MLRTGIKFRTLTRNMNSLTVVCRERDESFLNSRLGNSLASIQGSVSVVRRYPNCNLSNFNIDTYFNHLKTNEFGQTLIYGRQVSSTQTLLFGELAAAPTGTVFTCYQQVSGRGRGGNIWESPPGCLMFSYKFSTEQADIIVYLQYLCSLALVEAVKLCSNIPNLDLRIKWPNDIYAGPSFGAPVKVGGILCQSSFFQNKFDVCIGIGINVENKEPTTCVNALLEKVSPNQSISREALLGTFLTLFEGYFETLESEGFDPFREKYLEAWLHTNQIVTASDCKMRIVGLTQTGFLKAISVSNPELVYELQPDGNSFDFLQGLIVSKIFH